MLYYTEINDVEYSDDIFRNEVNNILNHPKGWTYLGYKFNYDNKGIPIRLVSKEYIEKNIGNGELSYFDSRPQSYGIYINYNNWMGNSKSSLPIERYRHYVINHEMGHALGYDHVKCCGPGNKGSVMMQMSKGPNHIYPCIENEFPLNEKISGGNKNIDLIINIIILLIFVITTSLLFITFIKSENLYYI